MEREDGSFRGRPQEGAPATRDRRFAARGRDDARRLRLLRLPVQLPAWLLRRPLSWRLLPAAVSRTRLLSRPLPRPLSQRPVSPLGLITTRLAPRARCSSFWARGLATL